MRLNLVKLKREPPTISVKLYLSVDLEKNAKFLPVNLKSDKYHGLKSLQRRKKLLIFINLSKTKLLNK